MHNMSSKTCGVGTGAASAPQKLSYDSSKIWAKSLKLWAQMLLHLYSVCVIN